MFEYQKPWVIYGMARDYDTYGYCNCIMIDTPDLFMIKRIPPSYDESFYYYV